MNAELGTRNAEQSTDLKQRTKTFALDVIRLVRDLPRSWSAAVIGKQLLRSGTSVAANYRSARRARSRRDFIAKMSIVEEEADESQFWLELLVESHLLGEGRVSPLRNEAGQLVAIAVSSITTARGGGRPVPRSAFRVPR